MCVGGWTSNMIFNNDPPCFMWQDFSQNMEITDKAG